MPVGRNDYRGQKWKKDKRGAVMGRNRELIAEHYKGMKKMLDEGCTIMDIAQAFNLSINSVYNTFNFMGDSLKKPKEEELLMYADNSVKLNQVVIGGKRYTDITPLFAGR